MTSWTSRAACLGQNPDRWFPTLDDSDNHGRAAKQICAGCPVRLECLVDALRRNEDSGIWGGAGEDVRRHLARALPLAAHDPLDLTGDNCRWCQAVTAHFATLDGEQVTGVGPVLVVLSDGTEVHAPTGPSYRNGDGAQHGLRVTYNRGCRCHACCFAVQMYGAESKYEQRSNSA